MTYREHFGLEDNPLWYKDAIIYELHVRAFYDSNGDGIGDFRGLTEKLDYFEDLGVTALWLLPFYPSPLRDDGYDIADYTSVNPIYGDLGDFKEFLREAHRRGLRVITELVMNHTSDQHPWFQRARRSPPNSEWRDFYVWSDTPSKYKDARIIFKDFEPSNWSWDPVANAYYWHRFFHHQPDLNFDNPVVRKTMMQLLDFWLGMGVDGMRLDAIPYLFERESTSCENLPETHDFLRAVRQHIDAKYTGRMLLAEANQWPEDAVAYFGAGDECNMSFHFPLMPRMFMALRMEDRYPIIDILSQTPPIPENCQWAIFLRNHDELTLEMVTDEERDYMYRMYAQEMRARINLGIRRRLAPLLGNDRRQIELLNALLFSMPGTPVLYYGDEIGMGDNIYLGDRDGVRTPIHWSPDRNAGFSRANPQKLYLPVIIDPEYHYEANNVEAQQNNPQSLFWWMKQVISLRRRHKAFNRGSFEFLHPENRKILAFVRRYQEEQILVIANLSRHVEFVEMDLGRFRGMRPLEMFGGNAFPTIGDGPYFLTLAPYGFYWFKLEPVEAYELKTSGLHEVIPSIAVPNDWESVFGEKTRVKLEEVLPAYLKKNRWFGGKARRIKAASIGDRLPIAYEDKNAYLLLVRVQYTDGDSETYQIPVAFATAEKAAMVRRDSPAQVVASLRKMGSDEELGVLHDAIVDRSFCTALCTLLARNKRAKGERGELIATTTRAFKQPEDNSLEPSHVRAEQSNTSIIYGNNFILKLFRRVAPGINPDLEIGRYFLDQSTFNNAPALAGSLEYATRGSEPTTLGIMHEYVANLGDAWSFTLDSIDRFFENARAQVGVDLTPSRWPHPMDLIDEPAPALAEQTIQTYLLSAQQLGLRTAQMHQALFGPSENPAFSPEPYLPFYQRSVYQSMRNISEQALGQLRKQLSKLPEDLHEEAQRLLDRKEEMQERFRSTFKSKLTGLRIRTHGDYHLGQVLYTGKDFVIIDFEGEPARTMTERRLKRSALRDLAGMLRSFQYAAYIGRQKANERLQNPALLEGWGQYWQTWVSAAFLKGYFVATAGAPFLPKDRAETVALLDVFLVEKALYELSYELNNRPDWVAIPLRGLLEILGRQRVPVP